MRTLNPIPVIKTINPAEKAFIRYFISYVGGKGVDLNLNLNDGSFVATRKIDSYINYG